MKVKKTAPQRRRISFAVDREEIEINSDWVDAVMASPAAVPPDPPPAPVVRFPAPPDKGLFFALRKNTATDAQIAPGEKSAPGEECTSVENISAVVKVAPVAETGAVEQKSPVEQITTVADSATVKDLSTGERGRNSADNKELTAKSPGTTVELFSTEAVSATEERFTSAKDHRVPRPRPIIRITDGLTPGQYAVYSLMYEAGEASGGPERIYKGGYADLGRLTGLSKRGIQNIVAELQAKQVISMHQQPGYHRTETSAYRVPDPQAVLQIWFAKGWRRALGKSKTLIS